MKNSEVLLSNRDLSPWTHFKKKKKSFGTMVNLGRRNWHGGEEVISGWWFSTFESISTTFFSPWKSLSEYLRMLYQKVLRTLHCPEFMGGGNKAKTLSKVTLWIDLWIRTRGVLDMKRRQNHLEARNTWRNRLSWSLRVKFCWANDLQNKTRTEEIRSRHEKRWLYDLNKDLIFPRHFIKEKQIGFSLKIKQTDCC